MQVIVILQDGKSFEGQVIAYDFHYNLIVVCFKADGPLQIATLRPISDCFDLNTSQLRLAPGDDVIAVGRYFGDSFSLMAAPGEYWYRYVKRHSYTLFSLSLSLLYFYSLLFIDVIMLSLSLFPVLILVITIVRSSS